MRETVSDSTRQTVRRYLAVLLAIPLIGIALVGGLNFAVDPLQRFRVPSFYQPVYDEQQRRQGPALARSMAYDAVLLGTSTAENVRATDAREELGVALLRLPVSGGSLYEQRLLLEVALASGKPRTVVWFIDGFALLQPKDMLREEFGAFPRFMYADGAAGVSSYLLNFEIARRSLHILAALATGRAATSPKLEELNVRDHETEFGIGPVARTYASARLRDDWAIALRRRVSLDPATAIASVESNIAALAAANPAVRFEIALVPASVAQLAFWSRLFPGILEAVLAARRAAILRLASMDNVRLHDFQADTTITADFSRYADLIHFDRATGRQILRSIAAQSHRVTAADVETHEARIRAQIADFVAAPPPAFPP